MVDTGAIDTLAPRRQLEAIGLAPRVYETADGRQIEMDVTVGEIEVMGELTAGLIIFGDDGVESLLGGHRAGVGGRRSRPAESTV